MKYLEPKLVGNLYDVWDSGKPCIEFGKMWFMRFGNLFSNKNLPNVYNWELVD